MSYDPVAEIYEGARTRPRSRWARWLLLAGVLMACAAALLGPLQADGEGSRVALIPIVFLPIAWGMYLTPLGREFFVPRREVRFDEFERATLNEATRTAYAVALLAIFALSVWIIVGTSSGWPVPRRPHDWWVVGLGLPLAGSALPVLIAEWRLPLPRRDEA